VRNLPEVTSETPLPGVSSSDIPLQEGSSSDIPAELDQKHLALKSKQAPFSDDKIVWIRWAEAEKSTEGSKPENNADTPKLGEPLPGLLRGQGLRVVPPWKGSDLQKDPGTIVYQGHIRRL
jgi:hypothetical protein